MRKLVVLFVLAALALAGGAVLAAQSGLPVTELPVRFAARAQARGNVGSGNTARVELTITRWSTMEQRTHLLETLNTSGAEALQQALTAEPEAGYLRVDGSLSYPLYYAIEFTNQDGKRVIRAVTDRPIRAFEAIANARATEEYAFTLVQLTLDADYTGDGAAAVAVQILPDPDNHSFTLQSYDTAPVHLSSVRRIDVD